MPRIKDRLAVVNEIIKTVAPRVRAEGLHTPHQASVPGHWELIIGDLSLVLTERVLRLPGDRALAQLLDVWRSQGGKVLSVDWMEERPWQPPRISCFKAGDWLQVLGIQG